MAVTASMGILQYYGNDITGTGMRVGDRIRGVGIFDTNQLAYTLAFCLPLIFGLFISTGSFFSKYFLIIIFSVYSYCIYLTQSRGGLLCSVFVIFLLFFIFNRNKIVKIFGIIFSVLTFSILLKYAPRLTTTFEYKTDDSAIGRIDAWGSGLASLKNNLFLGIGKDQFRENFGIAAHNGFIQVATELSLIGLFIWLALYYFSIRNLRIIDNSNQGSKEISSQIFSKAFQVSLYTYLMGSFFQSSEYYITLYILFALIVVLQSQTNLNISKKFAMVTFKDIRNVFAFEVIAIVLIKLLIKQIY
jgi:O-antigen ligase